MDPRRKSPTSFKRKGTAIGFFVVALAILVVGVYLGLGMLTRYDYEGTLPEDAELRANFAVDSYLPATPEPTPAPQATATPLPTPMPTPQATPLPLQLYSLQNTRMVMPQDATAAGEGEITSLKVSAGDDNRSVLVEGWAFLEGCDAEQSTIYLVVSTEAGTINRFYQVSVQPGASGVTHDPSKGQNLERADFRAAFKVGTYEEGVYRLGLLVTNRQNRGRLSQGYFPMGSQYHFYVKSNAVVSVG